MRFLVFVITLNAISGCTPIPVSTLSQDIQASNTFISITATPLLTEKVCSPTFTVVPTKQISATPSSTLIPPFVKIIYEGYAQVEILSPQGIRVLIDVYDPGLISGPVSERDILLTTHTHWDHIYSDFQGSFPGKQLMTQAGTIEESDIIIQGIPSAHNAGDEFAPESGTNYIYMIDAGSLRIVHFGDIGQQTLTAEQLELLGEVDIAITQLANPYSDMNAENQKGIRLMEQISPRLIIPTHVNLDSAKLAVERWEGIYSDNPFIELCASNLVDQTQILFLGQSATQFAERLNLTRVDW